MNGQRIVYAGVDSLRFQMPKHRIAAGISCVAVKDGAAYLAQVSPAWAARYDGGTMVVLRPTLPEATEPLGLHDEVLPEFSRFELHGADRLLLLTPALGETLSTDDIGQALALPAEKALAALYRKARSSANCGAVLVAAVSGGDARQET